MAKLTFHGAIRGVTGSAYLIETATCHVLLECGLVQGSHSEEETNRKPFPFDVDKLDAVVLSHAHLDHSGRIPKLVADGYRGPIYVTAPTEELLEIMLRDAASLELRDTEWENKRLRRAGKPEIEPLFTIDDAEAALALCECIPYDSVRPVAPGVEICFSDAGHILGSAIVQIFLREGAETQRKIVFSGDLGNSCSALLRDPAVIEHADVLMLESTYGDRDHRALDETLGEFNDVIKRASENGGNILIPAFAVGRTQEIIFRLGELFQKGQLQHQAVFLDSPMAIAATEVYHRYQNIFNTEDSTAIEGSTSRSLHSFLPVLRYSLSTAESMAINRIESGAIIIAGSGMCNGGRIRHHLKHNLWRTGSHVVIVGYQAKGTPGRALVDGAKRIRMAGEDIAVKASIHTLGGFSAHAGQSQLIDWVSNFAKPWPKTFLVHGEPEAKATLRHQLELRKWAVDIPEHGSSIVL